jgi:hypothetical protein
MATAYNPSIVTDGLVLYLDASNSKCYSGSGNNVTDLSGNNLTSNITFYNTPVITENSFDFTALNTDGISIASNNFTNLSNFTMECVFKVNGTHLNYSGAFISSGNWNTSHWSFGLNQANTGIYTRLRTSGAAIGDKTWSYSFSNNIWYFASYRVKNNIASMFIDGIQHNSEFDLDPLLFPLPSDASNIAIGRETYANGYFNLNGKIAAIRVYNRNLSDEEIQKNYNVGRLRFVNS